MIEYVVAFSEGAAVARLLCTQNSHFNVKEVNNGLRFQLERLNISNFSDEFVSLASKYCQPICYLICREKVENISRLYKFYFLLCNDSGC